MHSQFHMVASFKEAIGCHASDGHTGVFVAKSNHNMHDTFPRSVTVVRVCVIGSYCEPSRMALRRSCSSWDGGYIPETAL